MALAVIRDESSLGGGEESSAVYFQFESRLLGLDAVIYCMAWSLEEDKSVRICNEKLPTQRWADFLL